MTPAFVTPQPWAGGLQHDSYGPADTYRRAAEWLRECGLVADWGGAGGAFGAYLPAGVRYRVIDGTQQSAEQTLADLTIYRAPAEGILVRHVLEINPEWPRIVDNLLASFEHRAVIVTYTPPFTKVKSGWSVAPVALEALRAQIAAMLVRDEAVGFEHVFYLERQ